MWHPDPDQLSLAALPNERRDPAVDRHVDGCALCRGHVDSLRRTVDLALAGGEPFDDADHPPERIWTAITGELHIVEDSPRPRPRWRRALVPIAAAAAGVLVGVAVGFLAASGSPAERPLATLAPVAASGTTGTAAIVDRDGLREVVVRVDAAALPPGADYLEAWLLDADGDGMLSLGALAAHGDGFRGTFSVPGDLPLAEYRVVDVSAERWDGDPGHSLDSLARGPIGP